MNIREILLNEIRASEVSPSHLVNKVAKKLRSDPGPVKRELRRLLDKGDVELGTQLKLRVSKPTAEKVA
jgi:hypothetical protein